MTIWFTSDTHFSHKNSMRYCGRPFFTTEQMDEAMIANWNRLVKPEDTIYHLGDVTMHAANLVHIMPRLNGHKILIIGNHDLIYPYFEKRGKKFMDKMWDVYQGVFHEIHPSGYEVLFVRDSLLDPLLTRLSHFPTKDCYEPRHQDKHDAFKPKDTGILNICGHVHQAWLKRGNNINVGVDVWNFEPVSLETVVSLWRHGDHNVETPNKLRIVVWTAYHSFVYHMKRLKDLVQNGKQNGKR